MPYPSYSDRGSGGAVASIAKLLEAGPGLPNTVFFDRSGEASHHWRGSYSSEDDLAAQIEEYAR